MLALAIVPLVVASTAVEPLSTSYDADVGVVHVSIKLLVAATERAVRVPIEITATSAIEDPPRFVDVEFCTSWPCAVPERVRAELGTTTNAQITLWPQGFIARVRDGAHEGYVRAARNPTHVVAVTSRAVGANGAELVHIQRNGAETGVVTAVFVGSMLREHPELLDAFGAFVATSPSDVDAGALSAYRARGGVVYACVNGVSEQTCVEHVVDDLDRPVDPVGVEGLPALNAASVALQTRPPRAAAFALALVAVLAIAFVVRSFGKNRIGFARMLALSSTFAASSAAALWILELVAMPLESHARVVTWTGPAGGWEVGVDAARPRSEAEVHVSTPGATTSLAAVEVLGDRASVSVDDDRRGATATLRSSSALAAVWSRPSPHPRAVRFVAPADGVLAIERGSFAIRNDLDLPLDAIAINAGAEVALDVAPGEAKPSAAFAYRSLADGVVPGLPLAEQRLLFEVLNSCARRTANASERNPRCAAAVAREKDGTLLGIEVSR